jgi:ADP-L-glycero-D-manno-heptose 6-epimerase
MIVLTGAGGFIGSVVLGYLNKQGIDDVVLFDDLPTGDQYKNLIGKKFISLHSTDEMFESPVGIECVIHIGANSSTLEKDWNSIYKTNVLSTRAWNRFCTENEIPFIFTSSAAVYGNGSGPLNHYAFSKHVSENEINGVVLRLFNVYGPNEYHKGRMASTIMHWHQQLEDTETVKVFEYSNRYRRDFIWVEDVASTIYHFVKNYKPGVYDLGTGESVDFESIANIVVSESGKGTKVYIPMPNDLKSQYQQDTKADISALQSAGVNTELFLEPWQGIKEYFKYLNTNSYY